MSDTLSIAATRSAADANIATFRRLLGAVLALEALVAVILLIWPGWILADPAVGGPAGARVIGALLAWAVLFQLPGRRDPVRNRLPVMIGMFGRAVVGLVCVVIGGGFVVAGLVAVVAALALLFVYHGMVKAVLTSRP